MHENSEAARLRIMAARIVAQIRWPYLSSVLFNLRLVETDSKQLPTMAVDSGWRLYYSPDFVMSESAESLATVLLHESLHCVMTHNERFARLPEVEKYPYLWNICGDCAINHLLDQAMMPWTESITPVRYSDFQDIGIDASMITETAYNVMLKWAKDNKAEAKSRFEAADCGSVAGGKTREYEVSTKDDQSPSMDSEQQKGAIDRVAGAILTSSSDRSSIPAGLLRWAQEHLEPQVDWRKQLGVYVRRAVANVAGRKDYSYMRPSRRQDAMRLANSNVLLPSLRQPSPPRVAVVVDTSGSIGDEELRKYIGELSGIVRAVGISGGVSVIACDAKAYPTQILKHPNHLSELKLHGGGGTDMREGISAAISAKRRPHVIVTITDGFTPWPEEKPFGFDHFLVLLTNEQDANQVPEWMRTIFLK
jgi:predicted metal-dependent peptidase